MSAEPFSAVTEECLKTSAEALSSAQKLVAHLKSEKDRDGISLYEVKNHDLLAYMSNLAQMMALMAAGQSIQGCAAIDRCVLLRTVLERMRPLEVNLKTHLEKLTAIGVGTSRTSQKPSLKAHPETMRVDEEDGEGENDSEENFEGEDADSRRKPTSSTVGKYVAPKFVAVPFDEDDEKEARQLARAKARALQSSLIGDLRSQYSEAPELIREEGAGSRKRAKFDSEKQKYEEDYFVRLQMSKKERHQKKLESRQNLINDLLHFGDYMAVEEEGERKRKVPSGGKGGKKLGGPRRGGPKGAKRDRFERMKPGGRGPKHNNKKMVKGKRPRRK